MPAPLFQGLKPTCKVASLVSEGRRACRANRHVQPLASRELEARGRIVRRLERYFTVAIQPLGSWRTCLVPAKTPTRGQSASGPAHLHPLVSYPSPGAAGHCTSPAPCPSTLGRPTRDRPPKSKPPSLLSKRRPTNLHLPQKRRSSQGLILALARHACGLGRLPPWNSLRVLVCLLVNVNLARRRCCNRVCPPERSKTGAETVQCPFPNRQPLSLSLDRSLDRPPTSNPVEHRVSHLVEILHMVSSLPRHPCDRS